jgi:hypothetical protein
MDRIFQALAVILIGVAAYFLWSENKDGTFVAAVLGAVAFFLSIRFQAKARLRQHEIESAKVERREAETE